MKKETLLKMVTYKIESIVSDALDSEWEMLTGWGETKEERVEKLSNYADSEFFEAYPRFYKFLTTFCNVDLKKKASNYVTSIIEREEEMKESSYRQQVEEDYAEFLEEEAPGFWESFGY